MSQHKDGFPSVSRETQDYIVSHDNFDNGNVPIYWGPDQETSEAYVPPNGPWNKKSLMSVPEMVRVFYSDLEFEPTEDECCKTCTQVIAESTASDERWPNLFLFEADDFVGLHYVGWSITYEVRCYDEEGGYEVLDTITVDHVKVNDDPDNDVTCDDFSETNCETFAEGTNFDDLKDEMQAEFDSVRGEIAATCDIADCVSEVGGSYNDFFPSDGDHAVWSITYTGHTICPEGTEEVTEGHVLTTNPDRCADYPDLDCTVSESVTEEDLDALEAEFDARMAALEEMTCEEEP